MASLKNQENLRLARRRNTDAYANYSKSHLTGVLTLGLLLWLRNLLTLIGVLTLLYLSTMTITSSSSHELRGGVGTPPLLKAEPRGSQEVPVPKGAKVPLGEPDMREIQYPLGLE